MVLERGDGVDDTDDSLLDRFVRQCGKLKIFEQDSGVEGERSVSDQDDAIGKVVLGSVP